MVFDQAGIEGVVTDHFKGYKDACLLAGRVVELRPGPGSSRPKYLCCTLAPHLPDWNSASPAYPMVKKPVSC